jgi:thiol:disulfide interchange protein
MNEVYLVPSFYAHILNGILLLFAFIMLCKNYSKIRNVEPYKLIILILFFSLSIGVHGLSHLGMEQKYGFNPITIITK